ncbi:unnamed protein product, partial [Hapterophycus canaliculatus]
LLYSTARWQLARKEQLTLIPMCEDCSNRIAREVHHTVRHHCSEEIFFSCDLMSLCKICHNIRTAR